MLIHGKSVAEISSTDEDKFGPNGGFTAILSTPSLDRDGDRLHRDEWIEPLPDRLPLDIDHGMSVADTIGSFHPYFDGDTMLMDAYFASTPKAQEVRTLINEGHISTVSVAFMTDKSRKDNEPRRELLNAGVVNTPSNRDAVILDHKAAKSGQVTIDVVPKLKDVPEFRNELSKILLEALEETLGAKAAAGGDAGALTQAIHDAAVHLGALCIQLAEDEPDADDDTSKSADEVDTKEVELENPPTVTDLIPEGWTLEQFQSALANLLNPKADAPDESPADEAASDEEPAEDAADESADEADPTQRAQDMLAALNR